MSLKQARESIKEIQSKIEVIIGDSKQAVIQRDNLQKRLLEAQNDLSIIEIKQQISNRKLFKNIMIIGLATMSGLALLAAIPAFAVLAQASFVASLLFVANAIPAIATGLGYMCGYTVLHGNVILAGLGLSALVSGFVSLFAKLQSNKSNVKLKLLTQEKDSRDEQYKKLIADKFSLESKYDKGRKDIDSEYQTGLDKIFADFDKPFRLQREAREKIIDSESSARNSIARFGLSKISNLIESAVKPLNIQKQREGLYSEKQRDTADLSRQQHFEFTKLLERDNSFRQAVNGLSKLPAEQSQARQFIIDAQFKELKSLIQREPSLRQAADDHAKARVMRMQELAKQQQQAVIAADRLRQQQQAHVQQVQVGFPISPPKDVAVLPQQKPTKPQPSQVVLPVKPSVEPVKIAPKAEPKKAPVVTPKVEPSVKPKESPKKPHSPKDGGAMFLQAFKQVTTDKKVEAKAKIEAQVTSAQGSKSADAFLKGARKALK